MPQISLPVRHLIPPSHKGTKDINKPFNTSPWPIAHRRNFEFWSLPLKSDNGPTLKSWQHPSPVLSWKAISLLAPRPPPSYMFSVPLNPKEIYPKYVEDSPCSQDSDTSQWRRIAHLFWHTENFSTVATCHVWKLKERPNRCLKGVERERVGNSLSSFWNLGNLRPVLGSLVINPMKHSLVINKFLPPDRLFLKTPLSTSFAFFKDTNLVQQ